MTDHITTVFRDTLSGKTEIVQVISLGEDVNMCVLGDPRVLYNMYFTMVDKPGKL